MEEMSLFDFLPDGKNKKVLKILVACEESQVVCKAFREKGHEAYSCDIIKCSGGHPEWHIKCDVLSVLSPKPVLFSSGDVKRCILFTTMDGKPHCLDGRWDMIIAFPPCTFLTNTGNRWFNIERYGKKAIQRIKDREEAAAFFMDIWGADCDIVVIENPIGYMSTCFRKPDQIIHPYYFAEYDGDENCERKSTCIWLRGVNPLKYEIKYMPRVIKYKNGKGTDSHWHMNTIGLPPDERSKKRSRTYAGVGKAMAEQWG